MTILAVISGFVIMAESEFSGLLVIVIRPVVAWVSTLSLYGFGQLVENSDIIAKEYRRKNDKHENDIAKSNELKYEQTKKQIKTIISNSSIDADEYVDITCFNCKSSLLFTKDQLQTNDKLICPMCNTTIHI